MNSASSGFSGSVISRNWPLKFPVRIVLDLTGCRKCPIFIGKIFKNISQKLLWRDRGHIKVCQKHPKNLKINRWISFHPYVNFICPYLKLGLCGVRGIFIRGGKVTFPDFFLALNILFPGRNFSFWYTPNKFQWFQKVKSEKKKGPLHVISYFFPSIFSFPLPFHNFPSFLLHFPFFLCLYFPCMSTKICQWKMSGPALLPPPPPRYATACSICSLFCLRAPHNCKLKTLMKSTHTASYLSVLILTDIWPSYEIGNEDCIHPHIMVNWMVIMIGPQGWVLELFFDKVCGQRAETSTHI